MPDFDTDIAPAILGTEGGYVNDPNDSGGETIWGITKAVARANGYTGPMINMQKIDALRIYRQQYWQKPGFDMIGGTSFAVAKELFDTGVNQGVTAASKYLQTALNAFNRQGADYPDVTVDGKIGPATGSAFHTFVAKRGALGIQVMLRALEAQQGAFYLELATVAPRDENFEFGWFANRLEGRYDVA